ncbi:MAG: 3-dehydroquinate synthase II [Thermoproteota archaeon]|nr:3-dehydroquinate synthase II [Thermoproteota archaeon]
MTDLRPRQLIIKPTVGKESAPIGDFLSKLKGKGDLIINIDPKFSNGTFRTMYESKDADIVVCSSLDEVSTLTSLGKSVAYFKKVMSNHDIDDIETAQDRGAEYVIVDAPNWKIIPLENIIAKLHKSETKILATAENSHDVATLFSVLELGVDGVILSTDSEEEVERVNQQLNAAKFPISNARIIEVKDVGIGERVCVDTASMMRKGEGMLVGSKSNFMLLVHNESIGSSFTSPRPFRVNAGAVYCYTIVPGGATRYLSEIESGSEVWIVNEQGFARTAVVGRSKIETRPLRLIRAEIDGQQGTVILQNAETIRLISRDGKLLSVTEVRAGDEVLGYAKQAQGRHFGMEVDEFIVEK